MFTESVKAAQERFDSREHNERFAGIAGPNDRLTPREAAFIEKRDSFFVATVNEDGWPYVQHRGGPPGFLRVLGPDRLAFADFRGNRQMISVGNTSFNDRASLILMDYPNRKRLKILGHMTFQDAREVSPEEITRVELPDYRARVERIVTIEVVAFDWNCPQHITRRYSESEWAEKERDGSK